MNHQLAETKTISNKCVIVQPSVLSSVVWGRSWRTRPLSQRSAQQSVAGFCWGSNQQAEDWGRGMARSFLRPPFMCA